MLLRIFNSLKGFLIKLEEDHVNAYSAQASFFMILSVFPFTMLLLTLIKYTKLSKSLLLSQAVIIMPDALDPLVISIIDELYAKASTAVISLSAIVAIWSASKGVLSMIKGLNSVFDVDDKRNYFVVRFIATIYTSLFLFAIIVSLTLLVFGRQIYRYLEDSATVIYRIIGFVINQRLLLSVCILTLLFLIIYKALPAKKFSFFSLLPGALFSALGWIILSFGLSIYMKYFNFSYTYGSLTTFILLMLWMYIGMSILFIGAEINIFYKSHLKNLYQKLKNINDEKF